MVDGRTESEKRRNASHASFVYIGEKGRNKGKSVTAGDRESRLRSTRAGRIRVGSSRRTIIELTSIETQASKLSKGNVVVGDRYTLDRRRVRVGKGTRLSSTVSAARNTCTH